MPNWCNNCLTVEGKKEEVEEFVEFAKNANGNEDEQIFDFNYSTNAVNNNGNLGFGLWWVKTLMTRFGGTISVESDGLFGATFILVLLRTEVDT